MSGSFLDGSIYASWGGKLGLPFSLPLHPLELEAVYCSSRLRGHLAKGREVTDHFDAIEVARLGNDITGFEATARTFERNAFCHLGTFHASFTSRFPDHMGVGPQLIRSVATRTLGSMGCKCQATLIVCELGPVRA